MFEAFLQKVKSNLTLCTPQAIRKGGWMLTVEFRRVQYPETKADKQTSYPTAGAAVDPVTRIEYNCFLAFTQPGTIHRRRT